MLEAGLRPKTGISFSQDPLRGTVGGHNTDPSHGLEELTASLLHLNGNHFQHGQCLVTAKNLRPPTKAQLPCGGYHKSSCPCPAPRLGLPTTVTPHSPPKLPHTVLRGKILDDFLALAQVLTHDLRNVRRTLFHNIYAFF